MPVPPLFTGGRMKRLIAGILALLALWTSACADGTGISIRELRETMPEKWECEIITDGGETVSVSAPVHIPDVEVFPVPLCETWFENAETPFEAGDEKFLFGKADNRARIEICDPAEFPETGTSVEDVIAFFKQKLAGIGVENIDLVPYSVIALGRMCKTKPYRWQSEDGKVGFPISVADPEKPWKNDDTSGWDFAVSQRVGGIPVILDGITIDAEGYLPDDTTRGYVRYIDEEHYYMYTGGVRVTGTVTADAEFLPAEKLFSILEERIRKGQLKWIVEINLGYLCLNRKSANLLVGLAPEQEFEHILVPVWQVRCYDTVMKNVWHDHCAICSPEDDVRYDTTYDYHLLYDAGTGRQLNYQQ